MTWQKYMQKLSILFKDEIIKYLLAAVLIIVPLFPKFPLFSVPGTYVAVRFEDVILLVLGIVTLIRIIPRIKIFLKDKIVISLLIFFAVTFVSLLSGFLVTKTVSLHLAFLNYARRIEYLIPLFALLTISKKEHTKDYLDYFLKVLIGVTFVCFIYGLGQRYLSFPIIITQNSQYSKGVALRWTEGSHISSTFAGHYDLAAFMVMVLPILITLLFTAKGWWNRIIFLVTSGGGMWLLINSLSRISQVSYLAAVTIALFFSRKYKALAAVLVISVALIATSSSLGARFARFFEVYYQKIKVSTISSISNSFVVHAESQTLPAIRTNLPKPTPTPVPVFEDRSTSIRLNFEWPRALRAFYINPIFGTGYSSINLATDNDFLRMLGETGVLGFLAFMLVFVSISDVFVKSLAVLNKMTVFERAFVLGIMGAVIGTFICATFIDIFEASKFATIFWFMIGYSIILIRNYINE